MNRLKEVMKTIIETKKMAESVADTENPHLRRGQIGMIQRAKEDLNSLFDEYRDLVRQNCVFILASGSQGDKFADISAEEFHCVAGAGDEFYKKLVTEVNPRMYTHQSSCQALFDIVGTAFENIALDLGIIGYMPLIFEQKFQKIINNEKEAVELIARAFNEKVGTEVVAYYFIHKAANLAIENEFEGSIVPIIIHSKNSELIKEFASKFRAVSNNIFMVSTGGRPKKDMKDISNVHVKSVTTESVEKALITIRENL